MAYVKGVWIDDDGSGVVGTTVTAARMNAIEQGIADAHSGLTSPPLVTALPVAPVDRQEVLYLADDAGGVVWHLRYRALKPDGSANGSAFKWEYVGGAALGADVPTNQVIGATAFADLATVGPQVTVPLAGDYDVDIAAALAATAVGVYVYAAVKRGGAVTLEADGMVTGAGYAVSVARTMRMTGLAAADVLKLQYHVNTQSGTAESRSLRVRPVRVG